MNKIYILAILAAFSLVAVPSRADEAQFDLTCDAFTLHFNNGNIDGWRLNGSRQNNIPDGHRGSLLALQVNGQTYSPTSGFKNDQGNQITLAYDPIHATATVAVTVKPTHVTFELFALNCPERVELAQWGTFPTIIRESIGETVGVVHDDQTALGILGLNPKTLGGIPHDNDIMGGRGDAASATDYGSQLSAYTRNRDKVRVVPNWGWPKYTIPSYDDGGLIGSKIALVACVAAKALDTIGQIEIAEQLPHPTIDGVWAKQSSQATASYIIAGFSEDSINDALAMTKIAGLHYLYHDSPFVDWGHFHLRQNQFPHGWDGYKTCVDKAEEQGIHLGFHTLSNFITTNDPYVTPKPDPRLAIVGVTPLAADVDAAATEIPLTSPEFFTKNTTLNAARIGDEIIQFNTVSETAPYKLRECTRGAFGTTPVTHKRDTSVARLLDHPYATFLGDASLSQEMARTIADFCNRTGARQLSFDGLEGNWSTGMGQYGRILFTNAWYEALNPAEQGHVINDASNPAHYSWHIYTRMNWGEPWYAGFRESQTAYRLKNQEYYTRNLMPRMLGWFALRPNTSIEDAEWLLARAAGFDAGFALTLNIREQPAQAAKDLDPNQKSEGATFEILRAVNQWETARLAGAFPEALKPRLQDINNEFHLEPVKDDQWNLYPVYSHKGKPDHTQTDHGVHIETYDIDNPYAPQHLRFTIQNIGKAPVEGIVVMLGGANAFQFDQPLQPGQILRYRGGEQASLYNSNWKELQRVPINTASLQTPSGKQAVRITNPTAPNTLKAEFRLIGPPWAVKTPK